MLYIHDHNNSLRWILKFSFHRGNQSSGFDLSKVKQESGRAKIPILVFDNKALICLIEH